MGLVMGDLALYAAIWVALINKGGLGVQGQIGVWYRMSGRASGVVTVFLLICWVTLGVQVDLKGGHLLGCIVFARSARVRSLVRAWGAVYALVV